MKEKVKKNPQFYEKYVWLNFFNRNAQKCRKFNRAENDGLLEIYFLKGTNSLRISMFMNCYKQSKKLREMKNLKGIKSDVIGIIGK